MCRFQSGFVFKHPLLQDLEYYWRIEPDVHYFCDIDYDPFVYMKKNNLKYGWNIAPSEYEPTVRTLWNSTQEFMNKNPDMIPSNSMIDWVRDSNNQYTRCHFWSNFEIVDLSFYRSKEYQAYFDFLDHAGGFFYERWGDAPVHSIAVSMFLPKSQVHYFDDIGYYHPAMSHCPDGSKERGKCVCDPKEGWANGFTCAKRWRQISVLHMVYKCVVLCHATNFCPAKRRCYSRPRDFSTRVVAPYMLHQLFFLSFAPRPDPQPTPPRPLHPLACTLYPVFHFIQLIKRTATVCPLAEHLEQTTCVWYWLVRLVRPRQCPCLLARAAAVYFHTSWRWTLGWFVVVAGQACGLGIALNVRGFAGCWILRSTPGQV
ncbi:hypothetical protein EV181_001590 [Coemansia sp. RSA 532]|nr:hypothetical protein EV181_001590 [Coemansia sp. RSA 532]